MRIVVSCLGLGLAGVALAGTGGLALPVAAALAGGIAGNLATDLFHVAERQVAERYLDGRRATDENHHVDQALRLAHLHALGVVLARIDDMRDRARPAMLVRLGRFIVGKDTAAPKMTAEEWTAAGHFAGALTQFISAEKDAVARAFSPAGGVLTTAERRVQAAVLASLPDGLGGSLAARRTRDADEVLGHLRTAVEAAVLAEVRLRTRTETLPDVFQRAFDGTSFPDAWFDLFVRDAAARLKREDGGFASIWQAEQTAMIQAVLNAHTDVLDEINRKLAALPDDVAVRVLEHLRASGLQITPVASVAVEETVIATATAAATGDAQQQEALAFLTAGKLPEAEQVYRAITESRLARMAQDRTEAIAAFRHLGSIAALSNQQRALGVYESALALDPDDIESLFHAGWIQREQGPLAIAEDRLRRAAAIADASNQDWYRYWSRLGLGDVQVAQGNLAAALISFEGGFEIARRLAAADPEHSSWKRDLSVSYDRIGDVEMAQGNLPAALRSFQDSCAIRGRLAAADPGHSGWQRDLSVSYDRIGDVQVAQGNPMAALRSFQHSLAIRRRLAVAVPEHSGWQRDLSISYNKIGDVQVAQGNLPAALKSFHDGLDIARRLAAADPGHSVWQRDLSISYSKVGDVQVMQGNLPAALRSFQNDLEIARRVAAGDPGHSVWQRDLSISYDRIGDVQVAQGNLPAALKSFHDRLEIARRLVAANPEHSVWQRDLSVSYDRIGCVQLAQGNLPAALRSFQDGLAIRGRLAAADPGHSVWQRELSVSYNKIGSVQVAQGNLPAALKSFQDSLAIQRRLAAADPGHTGRQRDLSISYNKIGDVQVAQGHLPAALRSFQDSLAIRGQLAAADPGNAEWQHDLSISHSKLAKVHFARGDITAARQALLAGLDILRPRAREFADWASWQSDLRWFEAHFAELPPP